MQRQAMKKQVIIFFCYVLVSILIGAYFLIFVVTPLKHLDAAQNAIISQYLAMYCHPKKYSSPIQDAFKVGQMAALSRVLIAANLQIVGTIELAKCRL